MPRVPDMIKCTRLDALPWCIPDHKRCQQCQKLPCPVLVRGFYFCIKNRGGEEAVGDGSKIVIYVYTYTGMVVSTFRKSHASKQLGSWDPEREP